MAILPSHFLDIWCVTIKKTVTFCFLFICHVLTKFNFFYKQNFNSRDQNIVMYITVKATTLERAILLNSFSCRTNIVENITYKVLIEDLSTKICFQNSVLECVLDRME